MGTNLAAALPTDSDRAVAGSPVSSARPWLAAVGVLGVAAVVRPQLPAVGPLCPLRRVTGVPCPACGASACVVAVSRGDLGVAAVANPFVLVALIAVVVAALVPAWRAAVATNGSRLGNRALLFVPVLALSWLWQLHRFDAI